MNRKNILLPASLVALCQLVQAQAPAYPPPPSAVHPITAIEWFIDQDPGLGNATPLTITNAIDIASLTRTVPLSVSNGIHRLFVRSKDQDGHWSLTAAQTFENFRPGYPPPPAPPAPISQLEVFFDNDPGPGHGSIQTLNASTDIDNDTLILNIDTLSKGQHTLFVRTVGISSLAAIKPFSNDVPLPLTWLYIKAEDIDGQSQISWATAQESNTLQFDIEYSPDGLTYTTIGTTSAAGNSNTNSTYKWTHKDPAPGINYYRIKQIDLDKQYTWSKVVTLFYVSGLGKTTILPNPVSDQLSVLLAAPSDRTMLKLYNTAGQTILKVKLQDGTKQHAIDISTLPAGIYFLELQSKNKKELLRVVKK